MNSYTYTIVNAENGMVYVGKTNNPKTRWNAHISAACQRSSRSTLQVAIRTFGEQAFVYKVVGSHCTDNDALRYERDLIRELESDNPSIGYNLNRGGAGCITHTEAARAAMSAKRRGRPQPRELVEKRAAKLRGQVRTAEQRERMSASHRGAKLSEEHKAKLRAYRHSEETRARMSLLGMGKIISPETRERLRIAITGKKRSPETCERIGAASKGRVPSAEARAKMSAARLGKPFTAEHRENMRLAALNRKPRSVTN